MCMSKVRDRRNGWIFGETGWGRLSRGVLLAAARPQQRGQGLTGFGGNCSPSAIPLGCWLLTPRQKVINFLGELVENTT